MKTPKPVLDRRHSIRISEELPFKVGLQDYEAEALTVNISANGALCLIERDIPLMTQLRIALALPPTSKSSSPKKIISIKGVVVRKEKHVARSQHCIAIYFLEMKPKDRVLLNQFIESRLSSAA